MTELEMKMKLHSIIANNSEYTTWTVSTPHLMMLVKQAVEEEREACAKVCAEWPNGRDDVYSIEQAIRARSNT